MIMSIVPPPTTLPNPLYAWKFKTLEKFGQILGNFEQFCTWREEEMLGITLEEIGIPPCIKLFKFL